MAGIYIHIPFCKTRCSYCDFYSSIDISFKKKLIDCLCKELVSEKKYINDNDIETIYFGGGTPSLLEKKDFEAIFNTIKSNYNINTCNEITLEANPDDLSLDYILMLKQFPFNRISIGVQSFINNELKLINRRHTAEDAIAAIHLCQDNGFENISIDLIYGYPSQTINNLSTSIDKTLKIKPKHISAYHLSYEKGSVLYQQLQRKEIHPIDEETSNEMFNLLVTKLKKYDFVQYEISNFSQKGYESKHNTSYWSGKQYLGIGPSAHSYNGTSRKWNIASINDYIKGIEKNACVYELEELTLNDRYNDYIITSLRTLKGASLKEIKTVFGDKLLDNCLLLADKHINNSVLEIQNNYLKFTSTGILLSDGIIADLLYVE